VRHGDRARAWLSRADGGGRACRRPPCPGEGDGAQDALPGPGLPAADLPRAGPGRPGPLPAAHYAADRAGQRGGPRISGRAGAHLLPASGILVSRHTALRVARSLEACWEARLAALTEAEQALQAASDTLPPLPSRVELEKLAADLPALWNAPTTTARDRKRLLRTLIADVTLLPEPDHGKVRIGIRWHTGATDVLIADRPLPPGPAKRSPSPAVEMVRRLGPTIDTRDLAERLNTAGTGPGR
jgi:hypothetical protein